MDKFLLLGTTIRQARKSQNLTQQQLGEFSGVGLNFISQLERGKSTVRLDKLLDVLEVLGIEICLQHGKSGITSAIGK